MRTNTLLLNRRVYVYTELSES